MIKRLTIAIFCCFLSVDLIPGMGITETEWKNTTEQYDYTEVYKEFKQKPKTAKEPVHHPRQGNV